jgi:hypothetical protein
MGRIFKIDNRLAAASCRCGWNFANSTDKIERMTSPANQ